jgi:hypothetical protein
MHGTWYLSNLALNTISGMKWHWHLSDVCSFAKESRISVEGVAPLLYHKLIHRKSYVLIAYFRAALYVF